MGVVHRPLLFVHLAKIRNRRKSLFPATKQKRSDYHGHTNIAPVTITSIPPVSFEGCASRVATSCLIFSNGRDYPNPEKKSAIHSQDTLLRPQPLLCLTYNKLLYYPRNTLNCRRLERQHRLWALYVASALYPVVIWRGTHTYSAARFCRLASKVL